MSATTAVHGPGSRINPLLRIGGGLGIAAMSITLLIFTVGCFGMEAVFRGLPIIPLLLALPGLVLSFIGGIYGSRGTPDADTRVLFAVFINALALFAALLEIAVWQQWGIFFKQAT